MFALLCYLDILKDGVLVNNYTFPPLIKACVVLLDRCFDVVGRLVHAHVVKFGFFDDPFVVSAFIEFYCNAGEVEAARLFFDRILRRDVVLWTVMVDGYGKVGDGLWECLGSR